MNKPRSRTVRELGGELWFELEALVSDAEADWRVRNKMIETAMGVLARHTGTVIENDPDLPVDPLPSSRPPRR